MGRKPIPPVDPNNLTIAEKKREASRRWKINNKEKANAASKAYRQGRAWYFTQKKREEMARIYADPEKLAEYRKTQRKSYLKNREKRIAYSKAWADANVEHLKEYRKRTSEHRVKTVRAWQIANAERYKASQKKWVSENMHVIRKHIALRRARIMSATIGDPKEIVAWEKEWKSRPTNICEWCRMETPTEMCETEHAEPLILGGAHNLDNLVISCKACNNKKRSKPLSKWLEILGRSPNSQSSTPVP